MDALAHCLESYCSNFFHPLSQGIALEGMFIIKNNLINWTPESTQLDTQYFAIQASHGVAKDTQNVAVFVNHPPIITRGISLFDYEELCLPI